MVMIVRDEEEVIQRALRSVWAHITAYCILDTGSSSGATQQRVLELVGEDHRPGMYIWGTWKGFAGSRTEALALCRTFAETVAGTPSAFEWMLMMDADDMLVQSESVRDTLASVLEPGTIAAEIQVRFGGGSGPATSSARIHVFNTRCGWTYQGGPVHEYPHLPHDAPSLEPRQLSRMVPPDRFWIDARSEGFRSREAGPGPGTRLSADIAMLETHVAANPEDTRSLFYLARALADNAGDAPSTERAVEVLAQVAMHPAAWTEERYVACTELVRLLGTVAVNTDPGSTFSTVALPALADVLRFAWMSIDLNPERREVGGMAAQIAHHLGARFPSPIVPRSVVAQLDAIAAFATTHGASKCQPRFLFGQGAAYPEGGP